MNFERPDATSAETSESHFDQYHQASLEIAQKLSRRWTALREEKKKNPNFLAGYPGLEEIDLASRPPKSGIQSWFESKMNFIDTQSDPDARGRMMYRIQEELERIKEQVDDLLGSSENTEGRDLGKKEKMNTISRKDVDSMKGKDFSEDAQSLLRENGFQSGDKIVFFAEKEREGTLESTSDGDFRVRDINGNPWGVLAILMDASGYIRRP